LIGDEKPEVQHICQEDALG